MAHLTIYQDSYIGATIVSNRFIDEYMTDANDAQLKVYLYLLRMLNAHLKTEISDIADRFNHTEKDVLRALKYWEKQGLLSLEYDEAKNLTGIHLRNLCVGDSKLPSVEATHAPQRSAQGKASGSAPEPSAEPAPSRETAPPPPLYIKPNYSADQLRSFRDSGNADQLIFLAETYLGRPLSAGDLRSLIFIREVLEFSDDLADYLLQYCVERGKREFRYIEKVAISWKEQGISTPKQAERASSKYDKSVYQIMNQLGKSGSPTDKEMEFITRWTRDYRLPQDLILEACDRTVLATDRNRFQYADGILSSWHAQNAATRADIEELDRKHQKRASLSAAAADERAAERRSVTKFGRFQSEGEVDLEELQRKMTVNR